jgi:folate-binding protein YgfZ
MDLAADSRVAELSSLGLLSVSGEDARAFLHAQLTHDIAHLAPDRACYAGWCSAKGRLLASFLVVPREGGFFLQLARDLVPAVAKRLAMFVLRSRVKMTDVSPEWRQYGVFGSLQGWMPGEDLQIKADGGSVAVRIAADRHLLLSRSALAANASEEEWRLAEIRAGRPLITQATQDQFVPQMVNYEVLGGIDFHKGCYPGQEVVARAQYRGQVKRRMARVRSGAPLQPGEEIYSGGESVGTVVNTAGDEALAVLQISTLEEKAALRAKSGAALEPLPLPYQIPFN